MRKYRKKYRGAALWLTVLATLALMTFFVGAILNNARSQAGITTNDLGEMQAHYAALGAINQAFVLLEQNPDWEGAWDYRQMPQSPEVFHSLVSDRSYPGLGENEIYLAAQGFTAKYGEGTPLAAVAGTAYRPDGGIQHAFCAGEQLRLQTCNADAYNSGFGIGYIALPSPAPSPIPTPTPGVTPSFSYVPDSADVGANEEVTLLGSTVDGKVVLPQAGVVNNSGSSYGQGANLNNSGSSHDGVEDRSSRFDLPLIATPFSDAPTSIVDISSWSTLAIHPDDPTIRILPPGAYRRVTVPDGMKLAFEAGEYYFEDGFYAESTSTRINLSLATENSLTKLFIGGELRLRDVDFRPVESGDPTATPPVPAPTTIVEPAPLRIYGVGLEDSSDEMRCRVQMENTNFSGLVIGEAIESSFRNCEIWGAVMGRSVEAENVTMHYDTALADIELSEHSKWRLRGLTQRNLAPPPP